MGCDIHTVWQKKEGEDWVDIPSKYDETRHYYLFAVLADVRNWDGILGGNKRTPCISKPRGLPEDFILNDDEHSTPYPPVWMEGEPLAPGETMGIWMGDHSFSWLSADEMLEWAAKKPEHGASLDYFFEEVKRLKDEHGEVRMVFGFDN